METDCSRVYYYRPGTIEKETEKANYIKLEMQYERVDQTSMLCLDFGEIREAMILVQGERIVPNRKGRETSRAGD